MTISRSEQPESPPDSGEKDILVFISTRESTCDECGSELGSRAWIRLIHGKGALCLSCADLDHLEFLPSGNACVSRRAKKSSTLYAVVLKWSSARRRYERQGLLVEEKSLEDAEASCLEDADARAAAAERRAERAIVVDKVYVDSFAAAVRQRYPGIPSGREIAQHACRKYSGRVGRSAAAKDLRDDAIDLAVKAHARHAESRYDSLLANGHDRMDARAQVRDVVDAVLTRWSKPQR